MYNQIDACVKLTTPALTHTTASMAGSTVRETADTVSRVLSLLRSGANFDYIGEDVTQLEHALQAAHAARLQGLSPPPASPDFLCPSPCRPAPVLAARQPALPRPASRRLRRRRRPRRAAARHRPPPGPGGRRRLGQAHARRRRRVPGRRRPRSPRGQVPAVGARYDTPRRRLRAGGGQAPRLEWVPHRVAPLPLRVKPRALRPPPQKRSEHGFGEEVARLVEGHACAKRYLCASDPSYHSRLTSASQARGAAGPGGSGRAGLVGPPSWHGWHPAAPNGFLAAA